MTATHICILPQISQELGRGSGFIAELEISEVEKKIVLMTCNHVLPTLSAAQKATFFFGRDSANKLGTTIEGQELLDSHYFLMDDKDVRLMNCVKIQYFLVRPSKI